MAPFQGPRGGVRVAAVGDSLLGQLESHGPTHLTSPRAFTLSLIDQGWRASVQPGNAWRTAQVRPVVGQAVDLGAQVVIISVGAGDVRRVRESPDPTVAREVTRRAVRLLLADLGGHCVVWPTIRVVGPAGDRRTAEVINEELDTADAASDDVDSPDWAAAAAAHPEWFIVDRVHLSPSGEAAFQRALLTAAARCVTGLG